MSIIPSFTNLVHIRENTNIFNSELTADEMDACNRGIQFSESYRADDSDCTVVYLPDEGITGNSHFMFQEQNNDVIAEYICLFLYV